MKFNITYVCPFSGSHVTAIGVSEEEKLQCEAAGGFIYNKYFPACPIVSIEPAPSTTWEMVTIGGKYSA